FTERQTTVSRLIEHETERSGPHDINLTIRTNRGHRALDRIVAIETVAACIRDAKRHRERLSLICRAGEIDLRAVFGIGAAVNVKPGPRKIHVALETRARRIVDNQTGLAFKRNDGVDVIDRGSAVTPCIATVL